MIQIFGEYYPKLPENGEYLTISFSPHDQTFQRHWENRNLMVNFIADYFKTFFVILERESLKDGVAMENMKHTVKYIVNELLENALKFQNGSVPFVIKMGLVDCNDKLIVCLTHGINYYQLINFQIFIKKLLTEDPDEMYINTMKTNARIDKTNTPSRLGLLSMICDYSAKLGWKFNLSQANPSLTTVSTMVSLNLSESFKRTHHEAQQTGE